MILSSLDGGEALAAEQIADRCPSLNHVMIGRRMIELERSGSVVRTDELHVNRSGRRAVKYRKS